MTQPTNGAGALHKSYGAHLAELLEYIASALDSVEDGAVKWADAKQPPDGWCVLHVRAVAMYLATGYDMLGVDSARIREFAPLAAKMLDDVVAT